MRRDPGGARGDGMGPGARPDQESGGDSPTRGTGPDSRPERGQGPTGPGHAGGSDADPAPADSPDNPRGDFPEEDLTRPLPEPVRSRVVAFGSDVLGSLPNSQVPPVLRRVARFEPRRRARLAGPQIAAQLETDAGFREQIAVRMANVWPELVEGLRRGVVPPAADPVTVGAAAYVIRPSGWARIVEDVRAELERQDAEREAGASAETIASLHQRLEQVRTEHKSEIERMRSELRSLRSTIADLRRKLHAERQRAKEADTRAERAERQAAERENAATSQVSGYEAENRRLRNQLTALEAQVDSARRAARTGRNVEEARLRVLLDVLLDAASGIRRELALPPKLERPADVVSDAGTAGAAALPGSGLPDDDPGLIDQLLALPYIHVLVDGYNVTKAGYGTLPLADQRARLLAGLDGLATRTKSEITCVFDGAEVEGRLPAGTAVRRVRLLFSDPDESADDLIIRLVRAEPPGRPVAVVTSDKEIIAAVRAAGARPVAARQLLRRLESNG